MSNLRILLIIPFIFFNVLWANELKKVTLQLSWFDQFQFAGYYMAKKKGFYKKKGLDVKINPFKFGLNIPNDVSNGKYNFAVGRETLILDKSNGEDIVALYAIFQSSPLILLSTKDSGITKVEDFKNRKIMTTADDASEVSIKAMIKSRNINYEQMDFLKHTHNIKDLVDNKTDVISAYISKSPFELQQMGIEYNIFDPKTYGFDMYSDMLYTNKTMINNNIDTVLAFKEASLKGWRYAYNNIHETVDYIYNNYNTQNLSKEELLYEAKELKKLSFYDTNELGKIRKEKIQRIYDLYNVMGVTKNKVEYDDFVYSQKKQNEFKLTQVQKEYLSKKEFVKTCIFPNSMPYSSIKNGQMKGLVTDFLKLIEDKIDLKFVLEPTNTWDESLQKIKKLQCDILPMVQMTKDRKKFLNFTSKYISLSSVLVTRYDKPFVEDFKNLKKVKIGITKGVSLKKTLSKKYPNIEIIEFDDLNKGLQKVENKELYGYITTMGTAWYALQNNYLSILKISGKFDEKIDVSMAVRSSDEILHNILEKVVKSINSDEIENLSNRWVHVEHKKEFDYSLLINIIVVISIVIAILLYRQRFLNRLNNSLNEKVKQKTQELQKINDSLEKRVKEEVEKNLKKDRLIARQSKMISLSEMIENIAHQWRQPLSLISTVASGMKIKKEFGTLEDKFFYESVDSIVNSANYLSSTIDDFRYFFKPKQEKEVFEISNTLEKTLNLLNVKFSQENIKIIKDLEYIEIYGHETELIQALINILNNARDILIQNNKDKRYIFITVKKVEDAIKIEILDNGGGIKKKNLDKIFEPYFTTKHSSRGTGIGLYMCHQIITKYMNGLIEVHNEKYEYENEKHKGAKLTITLYEDN
ncbi:MAG: ABC transporter substrate-binding protein [Campylobacterota bacterium]